VSQVDQYMLDIYRYMTVILDITHHDLSVRIYLPFELTLFLLECTCENGQHIEDKTGKNEQTLAFALVMRKKEKMDDVNFAN
jgi:hypothetical protein